MMGSFLTRALMLVLGYAYPAYECYKTVELNKPEIEQLRFWCQYWILVALLTIFERVGDTFISWLPMYSEAKLAFYVYLWYPKTRGTTYVYHTFFRPYISKHETEIDRNLLELRTRAGDMVVLYWQKAATYGQTRFYGILQYVASQSGSQSSRPHSVQHKRTTATSANQPAAATVCQPSAAARQLVAAACQLASPQSVQQPLPSATKGQQNLQESTKGVAPASTPPAAQPESSSSSKQSNSEAFAPALATEVMPTGNANSSAEGDINPILDVTMEDAVRVTRGRLRRRVGREGPSGL